MLSGDVERFDEGFRCTFTRCM